MIVVTGANGHLGRLVVQELLTRVPGSKLAVSVREPSKAEAFTKAGVRVEQGDFSEPESLTRAFDGAEQVLIVSINVLGDEAIRQHGNAIQAAKQAGAKRILYTSHQAASPNSAVAFARDHAATETLLQSCGVPYVSLRNGFYAESSFYQLGGLKDSGQLALPADGPVSWTARADLAKAAAAAIVQTDLFSGITPPLTSSSAITFAEMARMASDILGRPVKRVVISDEQYRQQKLAQGYPAAVVDMLASMFGAIRADEFNVVDPTLACILGHEPTGMAELLKQHLLAPTAAH